VLGWTAVNERALKKRHNKPNVRLQARAARGASLCKPLFGGTRARRTLLLVAEFGQEVTLITGQDNGAIESD
jgi:hypothetical protein